MPERTDDSPSREEREEGEARMLSGWRAQVERDREPIAERHRAAAERAQAQKMKAHPSAGDVEGGRETDQANAEPAVLGWRSFTSSEDATRPDIEWRAFKLPDEERERVEAERRAKMEERAEKRAERAEAAKRDWTSRSARRRARGGRSPDQEGGDEPRQSRRRRERRVKRKRGDSAQESRMSRHEGSQGNDYEISLEKRVDQSHGEVHRGSLRENLRESLTQDELQVNLQAHPQTQLQGENQEEESRANRRRESRWGQGPDQGWELEREERADTRREKRREKGREKGREKKKRVKPPIDGAWVKRSGLHYLGRFSASERHFRSVMMQKIKRAESRASEEASDHEAWVDAAVEEARLMGGLNDAQLAIGLARSMNRRGLARRAARQKLAQKKLGNEDIERALSEIYDPREGEVDPTLHAAARAAKKARIGPWGPDDVDYPTRQRQLAKLARRGFSYQVAQRVLRADLEEAEQWFHANL